MSILLRWAGIIVSVWVIGLAVKYRYDAHNRKGTDLICGSGRVCRK